MTLPERFNRISSILDSIEHELKSFIVEEKPKKSKRNYSYKKVKRLPKNNNTVSVN